jgi:hypothetical protein
MHQILNLTDLDCKIRPIFTEATFRICKQYKSYPECLVLQDVAYSGQPVNGGTFGDIYKGQVRGRAIAIKVMRIYEEEDVQNFLKVFTPATYASHMSNQDRSLRHKRFCGKDYIIQISCPSMEYIFGSSVRAGSA